MVNYRNDFKLCAFFLFFAISVIACSACAEESPAGCKSRFRIAIFKEEGFPSLGTPKLLSAEWLYGILAKDFTVVYINAAGLSSKKYLNTTNFDLLILPYGEAFPIRAFPAIKGYLYAGGGLFNIAGRPFWVPIDKINGRWRRISAANPYRDFLSPLGIKYYETLNNRGTGLTVTTSMGLNPAQPTKGNVFPYRIPAREFYRMETGKADSAITDPLLVKSWINPYEGRPGNIPKKWCLIGAKGNRHPLDPKDYKAQEILARIMGYLTSPLVIHGLETGFAGYYPGETVVVSLSIINNGQCQESAEVDFEILNEKMAVVEKRTVPIKVMPRQGRTLSITWKPKEARDSFYQVRAVLKNHGVVLDKEENGFVVLKKESIRSGPSISISGDKLIINGREAHILGANYYESKSGELMWLRPNLLRIRRDFQAMRALGLNFVRIHYHHSKWFRDYYNMVLKKDLDPYLALADTTAMPSDRSWRILDAIIQLSQQEGLVFCMDIFSLVPQEMGDPVGWLGMKERITEKEKIDKQKGFVELLTRRYKDVPGIAWDLWNEPRLAKEDVGLLRNWANDIKEVLRRGGDNHPVTIGDNSSLYLLDVLDYASVHTCHPREFSSYEGLSKPFIFQEVWNDAGCSSKEEKMQASRLNEAFRAFLKTKAKGFVPWQWTRQARLWDNASDAERWDDELGICVHDDGTLKPAGRVYSLLISLISNK